MSPSEYSYIAPFDGARCAFGRHETFPLRYSWLTKGFQELKADHKVFESEDATVRLGVGKNMVGAIRYWLQAARIVERVENQYVPTMLGEHIFGEDGYDPYLEDEATIWLIHWLIASNAQLATAWYWFFNRFHKAEFTSQEVAMALLDFVKNEVKSKASTATIKQDAAVVLRMYSRSRGSARVPLEEALDSPLSILNLVQHPAGSKSLRSAPEDRNVPNGILGFAVAELLNALEISQLPIEDLMYGRAGYPAIGGIFRLTENRLLATLEKLVRGQPGAFELRETAGIHQLYLLDDVDPLSLLAYQYTLDPQEAAA